MYNPIKHLTRLELTRGQKVRALVWVMLFLLAILVSGYILWLELFSVQPKVFSGINLTKNDITIKVGDESRFLKSFDTYSVMITPEVSNTEISVSAYDAQGELIEQRIHKVTRTSGVAIDIFAEPDIDKQCFMKSDVTSLFYSNITREITSVKVALQPTNSIYHSGTLRLDKYLYPDNYDGAKLPTEIARTEHAYGIYPISCADMNDTEKIRENIMWWTAYDPVTQRELFTAAAAPLGN